MLVVTDARGRCCQCLALPGPAKCMPGFAWGREICTEWKEASIFLELAEEFRTSSELPTQIRSNCFSPMMLEVDSRAFLQC